MSASTERVFRSRSNRNFPFPAMILAHILRNGVVLVPPFPAPKIPRLLHAGSVQPTDYFWHDGMSGWEPVSTRWEPDAGATLNAPVTTPPFSAAPPAPANPPPLERATPRLARWQRPSLLSEARRRYHETLFPWASEATTERSSG